MFAASIYVELGDERKELFWTDEWVQGRSVLDLVRCLCNAVGSPIKKQRTVAQASQDDRWIRDISGALTVKVILDYLHIWDLTREIQLVDDHNDWIFWIWTPDTTSSAYRSFFIGQHSFEVAKVLQKMRAPVKCKFFVWLVLHDRCWTADRRKRHGLQDDDTCALCSQSPESIEHLLVTYPFSREICFKSLRYGGHHPFFPIGQACRPVGRRKERHT